MRNSECTPIYELHEKWQIKFSVFINLHSKRKYFIYQWLIKELTTVIVKITFYEWQKPTPIKTEIKLLSFFFERKSITGEKNIFPSKLRLCKTSCKILKSSNLGILKNDSTCDETYRLKRIITFCRFMK